MKGLISLLIKVFSGNKPADILAARPDFIEELGLNTHLTAIVPTACRRW